MNKKTVAVTEEQYKLIINTLKEGFEYEGINYRPNNQIAFALTLEANLGIRISDVLNLAIDSIVSDGGRYRLNIKEIKTGKERTFTVPNDIYNYILNYALENGIKRAGKLVKIGERAIQKHLKACCDHLQIPNISTHSFRKYFATSIYNDNGYNIEMVRQLLQHSSAAVTQRYIGIQQKELEEALNRHVKLL